MKEGNIMELTSIKALELIENERNLNLLSIIYLLLFINPFLK